MGRRNEPELEEPWSILKSEVLKAREAAEASKRIQVVLDRHPKRDAAPVTPGITTPDTTPVVLAPILPPPENQSEKDWVARYMKVANCDRKTAERVYAGAQGNYKGRED